MKSTNGRLYIAKSAGKGRGVFTSERIEDGELIEICPVIPLNAADLKALQGTTLYDYYFLWRRDEKGAAIALGFGSLYNHSYTPNATYDMDFPARTIIVYAIRTIEAGEEISFNYNGNPDDIEPVWFDK